MFSPRCVTNMATVMNEPSGIFRVRERRVIAGLNEAFLFKNHVGFKFNVGNIIKK